MRKYLEGFHFTGHLALNWLNSIESPAGHIARWALELQQYFFEIQYRCRKQTLLADALSRRLQEILLQTTGEKRNICPWINRKVARCSLILLNFQTTRGWMFSYIATYLMIQNSEESGNFVYPHHSQGESSLKIAPL